MDFLAHVLLSAFTAVGGALLNSWLAGRQKGPPAEPFVPPDISPGTPITVLLGGTFRVRPVWTLMGPVRTEDVRNKTGSQLGGLIDIIQVTGKRYRVTGQGVLCYGVVTELRNIVFAPNTPLTDLPLEWPELTDFHIEEHFGTGPTLTVTVTTSPRLVGGVDTFTRILHGGHETLKVYAPMVFGGEDAGGGGGVGGLIEFYVGSGQHGPSGVLESIVGIGNVPSYRELAYVVFNDVIVGTRPQMPPIDFIVSAYPFTQLVSGLGSLGTPLLNRQIKSRSSIALAELGEDSEWTAEDVTPFYPIAALMVDRMYGLGRNPAELDLVQWNDAADTTNSEGIGVSLLLVGEKQPTRVLLNRLWEILGAVPRRHPETNTIQAKLVREEDYETMRRFTPADIIEADLTQRKLADTFNEVTVFFSNADKLYEEDFVTVRDKANIAATGSVRPINAIRYPEITYRPLALQVALRQLKAVSSTPYSGTIKGTRTMWDVERGDVARFEIPWLDFDEDEDHYGEIVLRVRAVNLGSPADNSVTLSVTEDVFAHQIVPEEVVDPPTEGGTGTGTKKRPPFIIPTQRQDSTTGYLDLVILDLDETILSIEASTSVGGAAPSAFVEITGPPYEASVALSAAGESTIGWRVRYNLGGTTTDVTVAGTIRFATLPATLANPVVVDHTSGPTTVFARSTGQQIFVKH